MTIPNTYNTCSDVSQYLGSALVTRSFSDESAVLTRSQVNPQCFQRIRLTRLLHNILFKQTLVRTHALCRTLSRHALTRTVAGSTIALRVAPHALLGRESLRYEAALGLRREL